ncbi:polysaccharide deacetylase family protein [Bacillus sp. JJ1562]|uniref:polysaccharide deacetylase family protein n=1 Tax=Bacillus sp. JJ1562 TaxID=3122960 RepID=UPI003003041A
MLRYFWVPLCTIFLLTNNEIDARDMKQELQPPLILTTYTPTLFEEKEELIKRNVYRPMATISIASTTYNSTKTTITAVELKENNINQIDYHIWRTADGPLTMKRFTSTDKDIHFSILFDIGEFLGQRGEYQIEAYKVDEQGMRKLIAQNTFCFEQRVPILMYHAIEEYKGQGLKGLFVSPANFAAQMRYLKENEYTLLTFEQWDERNKVNKPILVTFDDGMKNNMNALRVLQALEDEHFLPRATEFVVAGRIGASPYLLSSEDIKEMVSSGIFSIQSHTMSHADLPIISNYDNELNASKQTIENLTGYPVVAIAYPAGRFNHNVVEETKKYYTFAVTTKPGQFISKDQPNELLLLKRVRISNETTLRQFAWLVQ